MTSGESRDQLRPWPYKAHGDSLHELLRALAHSPLGDSDHARVRSAIVLAWPELRLDDQPTDPDPWAAPR